MRNLDCLFINPTTHIKMPNSRTELVASVVTPMGTIALADLLDREGYGTRIVNTGVEQMCNRSFTVDSLFNKYDASVVGIDLHWFLHAYDAIRIANIVKQHSNAFVVLGGFTASFFAEEILSQFSNVDAVIIGDAELPLLELLRHKPSAEFEEVPNLMYRDGESLKKSKRRYVADANDLDQLTFSNLNLLENYHEYNKLTSFQSGDLSEIHLKVPIKSHGWTCLGRGCSVNCSYCGGGKNAFRILTGRDTPIFRSKEKVVETLARFEEMKISCTYMDFDPYPTERKYYYDLFAMIRKEKIDISSQFLIWALSEKDFLRDFRRTFNRLYSTITVSPESGSEQIRKLNKGFYYSNEELFRWLNKAKNETIPIEVFFTSGLSWETEKHFEETIQLAKKIVEEYPVVTLRCSSILLEPCCPRFLSPEEYGVSLKFRRFIDFYDALKQCAEGLSVYPLGYETNNLSESKINKLSQRFDDAIEPIVRRQERDIMP